MPDQPGPPQSGPQWGPVPGGQPPYGPPGGEPPKKRKKWPFIVGGVILLVIIIGVATGNNGGSTTTTAATTSTAAAPPTTQQAASVPTITQAPAPSTSTPALPRTTTPAAPLFPPRSIADFKAFAQTGDASAIHAFASDSKGLPSCPTPNLYATANPGITGRQLEADESAFFVERGLLDQPCSAFLFLFNSPTEDQSGGYTVGRVAVDGTTSDSRRNLEVDTSVSSESFNFNF